MSSAYLEVTDISPRNFDSKLCFIQPVITHDVLCIGNTAITRRELWFQYLIQYSYNFLYYLYKIITRWKVKVVVAQSCLTPFNPMNYSPSGSSVHGILQARILEWVAIHVSRGSSWPRHQTLSSCIAGGFFSIWATREAPIIRYNLLNIW